MKTRRAGVIALLACEFLLLTAIVLWPPFSDPKYLADAYRARGNPPSDEDQAVVKAAWARKHKADRRFIVVGLSLMAVIAVPLWISIAKAGSLSAALWDRTDQADRLP